MSSKLYERMLKMRCLVFIIILRRGKAGFLPSRVCEKNLNEIHYKIWKSSKRIINRLEDGVLLIYKKSYGHFVL